jgi:hypothetical protein
MVSGSLSAAVLRGAGAAARSLVACAAAMLLVAGAAAASGAQDTIKELLRGPSMASAKLEALERHGGNAGLVGRKELDGVLSSVRAELGALAAAGSHDAAVQLWIRYLRALPQERDSERFRRLPPELLAAVRLQLARAEELFGREDYTAARRVAGDLFTAGVELEGLAPLLARATSAAGLAGRCEALFARVELGGAAAVLNELEGVAGELASLHAASPPRCARAVRLLASARAAYEKGDTGRAEALIGDLNALGVPTAGLRRELAAERQQAMVGQISRSLEPPAPAPAPRPGPAAPRPSLPPARPTEARRTPTPRPTRTPQPSTTPTPMPTATSTPGRQLPDEVLHRVRDAAAREAELYRQALLEAGAGAGVPHFRVEGVAARGWIAEVHLLAALDDPAAQLRTLVLPRAERQLLRLIAHRVLEEAPELASVELHLELQDGRSAPASAGFVLVESAALRLSAGEDVDVFWRQLDLSSLAELWR